jgi:hypothetical protein
VAAIGSIVTCYFDDSATGDLQIGVVAGYVAPVEVWDALFAPAWNRVLRDEGPTALSEFKAADCASGEEEFKGWSKEQRRSLVVELVSVIRSMPIYIGVGTAFFWPGKADSAGDKREVRRWRRRMETRSYGMCVGQCLGDALGITLSLDGIESVQPVLDEKRKFSEIVAKNFGVVKKWIPGGHADKVSFPIEGNSKRLVPLQAADLLAYETMKEVVNRCRGQERPPRKALVQLHSGRTPYIARIYEMPHLPLYNLYRELKAKPKPLLYTLFRSGQPIRSSGTWGID